MVIFLSILVFHLIRLKGPFITTGDFQLFMLFWILIAYFFYVVIRYSGSTSCGQTTLIPVFLVGFNECAQGSHNCHQNAKCTDLPEGFSCACKSGFHGDGVQCTGTVMLHP